MNAGEIKAMMAAIAPVIREYVDTAHASIIAENKALAERIEALEASQPERGEKGEPGADGKDVDPEMVMGMVSGMVAEAIAALPVQKGEKGEPGERGEKGDAGEKGEPGADGAGVADLVIDRDGSLVATFTDGRMKTLGVVIGKDGAPGRDGDPGKDGRDGFNLEDFDITATDDRTIEMAFERDGTRHVFELSFPVVLDRGVYQAGQSYTRGDAVTWAGSLWIAQKDTEAKPDSGEDWRLAVKRGRDGRDAVKA